MTSVTLYLDNSVLGGYFDTEFEAATRKLWLQAKAGQYRFVASVVTEREAARAPERVYNLFLDTFTDPESILGLETRAIALAQSYVDHKIVSPKYLDDAQHVAAATTHGIGVIVSWNFRHLANYHREAGFNRVNLEYGYPTVRIISPQELVYGNDD
jgi:predicted nucleic acid-binding protein